MDQASARRPEARQRGDQVLQGHGVTTRYKAPGGTVGSVTPRRPAAARPPGTHGAAPRRAGTGEAPIEVDTTGRHMVVMTASLRDCQPVAKAPSHSSGGASRPTALLLGRIRQYAPPSRLVGRGAWSLSGNARFHRGLPVRAIARNTLAARSSFSRCIASRRRCALIELLVRARRQPDPRRARRAASRRRRGESAAPRPTTGAPGRRRMPRTGNRRARRRGGRRHPDGRRTARRRSARDRRPAGGAPSTRSSAPAGRSGISPASNAPTAGAKPEQRRVRLRLLRALVEDLREVLDVAEPLPVPREHRRAHRLDVAQPDELAVLPLVVGEPHRRQRLEAPREPPRARGGARRWPRPASCPARASGTRRCGPLHQGGRCAGSARRSSGLASRARPANIVASRRRRRHGGAAAVNPGVPGRAGRRWRGRGTRRTRRRPSTS